MLKRILIQNYALIDELNLEFRSGLNVITGETGAGKSILLGALGLILGQRADSGALLDKSRKCIIEGEFEAGEKKKAILNFLSEAGLDESPQLLLRREINPEGRSRSFINDTPVNLQQLKEIGTLLVDLQAQHETLELAKPAFQMELLDAFAENSNALVKYSSEFSKYQSLKKELEELIERENQSRSNEDYLRFQFNELNEAQLKAGELEELENEYRTLSNSGEIREGLQEISFRLGDSEENLVQLIGQSAIRLQHLTSLYPGLSELAERLKSSELELKDIYQECSNELDHLHANPERQEFVQNRLDLIYRLQKKHRAERIDDLIALFEKLDLELQGIDSLEGDIEKIRLRLAEQKSTLEKSAEIISDSRKTAATSLEKKVKSLLAEVGMKEAVIRIELNMLAEPGPSGKDQIKLLFSANKGVSPAEIGKIASGGELSRLMLAVKTAVAKVISLPTLIFDEIDTGVSGEVAYKIGTVMQDLAKSHQLISITHLPQIASRGSTHFYVYKDKSGKKSSTKVRLLDKDERVVEVARMLSGDKPTAVSMENARELLNS